MVKKIVSDPVNPNEVSFLAGAKTLRGSRLLILSADAVLKNGGLLCQSGGLMLAVAAKELGVPVVAVSRSYCLSEKVMCGQSSLVWSSSGKSWFKDEEETNFRVCIGKQYEYVSPELVSGLISENRKWENESIAEIFEEYYA